MFPWGSDDQLNWLCCCGSQACSWSLTQPHLAHLLYLTDSFQCLLMSWIRCVWWRQHWAPGTGEALLLLTDQVHSRRSFLQQENRAQKKIMRSTGNRCCVNVLEHLCDFTGAKLHYNGLFLLRVRSNTSQQTSGWVQIRFCPDKHGELSVCL